MEGGLSSLEYSDGIHSKQRTRLRERCNSYDGSSRIGLGEKFGVSPIHLREIGNVHKIDLNVDDVIEGCVGRCKNGLKILQYLMGLQVSILSGKLTRIRIDAGRTRDENLTSGHDRVAVGADGLEEMRLNE